MATRLRRPKKAISPLVNRGVELLLTEDVPSLGKHGDIVRVKPGYARNYLLPMGKATVATEHNKKMVEEHKVKLEAFEKARVAKARDLASSVSKYSVTIEANANEEGHLYGSILAADISKSLQTAGYDVKADQIHLEGPLKELGMYTVKLKLHADVDSEVKVWVVPAASKA